MNIEGQPIKRNPYVSLFTLIGLTVLCGLIFSILSIFLVLLIPGTKASLSAGIESLNADSLRLMQFISALGTFIVPPVCLQLIEKKKGICYFGTMRNTRFTLLAITLGILVFANPFIDWLDQLNHLIHLPESFAALEQWMYAKEQELAQLTNTFLITNSVGDLIANLVVIALVAAVGEELMFRGALMNIFQRVFKNPHIAILITAFIFSAIHLQFLGFLPRLFLGITLGYLFYWSDNIIYPIVAHFCNNSLVVIVAWWLQRQGRSLDELSSVTHSPLYISLLSIIFTILIFAIFRKIALRDNKKIH